MNIQTVPATEHVNGAAASANADARFTSTAPTRVPYALSFGGVVKSERIKFLSLRSTQLTLLLTVIVGLGLSALIAWASLESMAEVPAEELGNYLIMVATFASAFLALIFGVLGVFAMSSEYSSGMILSSLTAVPRRSPVFVAKALVLAVISGVTALLLVAGGLGIAVVALPASAEALLTLPVISGALGTVGYLVLIALFAFGVATLLRSTAGGIAVVAGVTFVLPIAFQVLSMTGWEWVVTAMNYLPASLGSTMGRGIIEMTAGMTGLNFWQALGAMVVWVVVPLIPAALLFKRRDAH